MSSRAVPCRALSCRAVLSVDFSMLDLLSVHRGDVVLLNLGDMLLVDLGGCIGCTGSRFWCAGPCLCGVPHRRAVQHWRDSSQHGPGCAQASKGTPNCVQGYNCVSLRRSSLQTALLFAIACLFQEVKPEEVASVLVPEDVPAGTTPQQYVASRVRTGARCCSRELHCGRWTVSGVHVFLARPTSTTSDCDSA